MGSISHHIMPLLINSLGGRHTNTHTDIYRQSNSKKPGAHLPEPRAPGLITEAGYEHIPASYMWDVRIDSKTQLMITYIEA